MNVIDCDFKNKTYRKSQEEVDELAVTNEDLKNYIKEAVTVLIDDGDYFGSMQAKSGLTLWPIGNFFEYIMMIGEDYKLYYHEPKNSFFDYFKSKKNPSLSFYVHEFPIENVLYPEIVASMIWKAVFVNIEAFYHIAWILSTNDDEKDPV